MLDNNYRKCQEHIDKYLLKKKQMEQTIIQSTKDVLKKKVNFFE